MSRRFLILAGILAGLTFTGLRPTAAAAAGLYFSPSSKSVTVGSTVSIVLKVNSGGQAINASEGTVIFSTDHLRLTSISKSGSIFAFWAVGPNGSNSTGRISYSGGLPSPGYTGSSGTVINLAFQAISAGTGNISLTGAKILANDGQGTDVLSSVGTATVTIAAAAQTPAQPTTTSSTPAPTISSSTFPDQAAWYNRNEVTLEWTKPAGALEFSYDLSQSPDRSPDHTAETAQTQTTVHLLSDGVWYFALQARYASGWSSTTRFRLEHDQTAPEALTVTIVRDRGTDDPTPQVQFSATDATSGVDHYTVSIDGGASETAVSPLTLNNLSAGAHHITVTVFDRAGNSTASQVDSTQTGYPAPLITDVTSPLLLLDQLVVRGTATAGDTVTIFMNDQQIGQTVAGSTDPGATASGVRIQSPWIFTTDHVWRPGHYALTAQATSSDGRTSALTDPTDVVVSGHSILLGGQPVATIAIAPIVSIAMLLVAGLITLTMARLILSLVQLHRREVLVEEELDDIRKKVRRGQLTGPQVEDELSTIERQLIRPKTTRRPRRSRR